MNIKKSCLTSLFLLFFSILSIAQNTATPRNGEGLDAFLLRNKRPPKEYKQEFIQLNKNKFGKNNTLLLGVTYKLPPLKEGSNNNLGLKTASGTNTSTSKSVNSKHREPLFGKKYEEYTIKSHVLSGACFFLVSGHGGPDPGASAKVDGRELHEDEYAYDIMLRLARNLMEHGATVHIIIQDKNDGIRDEKYLRNNQKETCMGEVIPLKQKARLKQRCDKINQLSNRSRAKYKRAVFIHLDSQSKKKQLDVYFFHQEDNKESKKFAKNVRDTFEAQYKKWQPNRGFTGTIGSKGLYVLNNTLVTSIFAELANMQNINDQRRYVDDDNRQALANWLMRGFIKDYEESKK